MFALLALIAITVAISGCVQEDKICVEDSDCAVFGESGDCNCGCFNKDSFWVKQGECFCAAPISCKCVDGLCEGVYGMPFEQAHAIASSACVNLTENYYYNEFTETWWIDLDIEKEGCNPACVVSSDGTAEINWRCTGFIE